MIDYIGISSTSLRIRVGVIVIRNRGFVERVIKRPIGLALNIGAAVGALRLCSGVRNRCIVTWIARRTKIFPEVAMIFARVEAARADPPFSWTKSGELLGPAS